MSFSFEPGTSPLMVSIPHNGSVIPAEIAITMTELGQKSIDTDWFLDHLYAIPEILDASLLVAEQSRYFVDLNRPSDNQSLYPGQATTGLVPETTFNGDPIYEHKNPDQKEIQRRVTEVWQPYHQQLEDELNRLKSEYGMAILIEAHSIASEVPRLFPGKLPDFNIGTNHDQSCSPELTNRVVKVLESQNQFSHVVNERFVGGYITRHFGKPEENVHALQIELSQATYMDESSKQWDGRKAKQVQPIFSQIFQAIQTWIKQQA